jgi:Ulp1 family protease
VIIDSWNAHRSAAVEAAEAYPGVRKWTKGIDIFKKEFLVIPINEQ